ncbi:hypothetical protein FRC01_003219 [Tulasnella sp. 417]|nr:hypothetical protein FRC01_003219 [Tulasnella sp. 417]
MEQESSSTSKKKKKAKRERPVSKTAIPGTSWSRVKTSEGNIFYFNKGKKESVWEVPEEIAEAVAELEQEEEERGAEDEQRAPTPPPAAFGIGRKVYVEDPAPEVEEETTKTATAPDVEMANGEAEDGDEAWQRQVAEEMAAEEEASKEAKQGDTTEKQEKADEKDAKEPPKDDNAPQLSPEEARAPCLRHFSKKRTLIPSRLTTPPSLSWLTTPATSSYPISPTKTRAQRAAKASSSASAATETNLAPADEKLKASEAYEGLLRDEWRKKWKKDRRFFGFGRDDREREMGNAKRRKRQKQISLLLRENENLVAESTGGQNAAPLWNDVGIWMFLYVIRSMIQEASSSRSSDSKTAPEDPEAKRKRERQERQQKALKEREQQARKDKAKVEKGITRSMGQLSEKESVDEFMTLLTDAIRDPTATYDESLSTLSRSTVFSRSRLPVSQRISLFNAHVQKLRDKQFTALFAVFEGHTPGLDARFEDLPESVYTTSPAVKLGLGQSKAQQEDEDANRKFDERRARSEMRRLWEDWQAERNVNARENF